MLELVKKERLFEGQVPEVFVEKDSFKGFHMDVLESGSPAAIDQLSRELFGRVLTTSERRVISEVSHLVSRRSARIAAAVIVGSLTRVDRRSAKRVTVAVDGSLFVKYPGYHRMLAEAVRELAGPAGQGISLKLTKDGSGIGAAVIAAVVSADRPS